MKNVYFRNSDDYFTIMLIQQNYDGKNRVRVVKVFSDNRKPEVKDVVSDQDKHEYCAALMNLPASDWYKINPDHLEPSDVVSLFEALMIPPCVEISEDVADQTLELQN